MLTLERTEPAAACLDGAALLVPSTRPQPSLTPEEASPNRARGVSPRPDELDRWVAGSPAPNAMLRLFCFAHAGGGAAFFFPWRRALAPETDVRPILLPGRETRAHERPASRIEDLIDPLCDALARYLDLRYALFGHSTGAVLAFEAARRLTEHGARAPAALIVSGRRAPGLRSSRHSFSALARPDLLAALRALNGTPEALLEHGELLEAMLPALRADLALNESYRPLAGPRLGCPIIAYTGRADAHVDHSELFAWHAMTGGPFTVRCFDGDHFYLKGDRPDVTGALATDLRGLWDGPGYADRR